VPFRGSGLTLVPRPMTRLGDPSGIAEEFFSSGALVARALRLPLLWVAMQTYLSRHR